ncbi:MAG: YgiT-type zinc finger protein [Proteobacteria bacterium]|nr:YgiT-type zinc finger protein [Pseudomonadota bacterium]
MKKKTTLYDYGECEMCDTPMREQYITQDFWIRNKLIVIDGIPAGVCPQCGEKVVRADIGQCIAKLIVNSKRIAKAPKISVPMIRFEAEEVR